MNKKFFMIQITLMYHCLSLNCPATVNDESPLQWLQSPPLLLENCIFTPVKPPAHKHTQIHTITQQCLIDNYKVFSPTEWFVLCHGTLISINKDISFSDNNLLPSSYPLRFTLTSFGFRTILERSWVTYWLIKQKLM